MEPRVAAVAATLSVAYERQPNPTPPEPIRADRVEPKAATPDLRLIIEAEESFGGYVYKTVDRETGEVVSQIPREEVLKLREHEEYAAGDIVSTKA
ncbi:flagellar protein FlaG [Phenylobacterium sp.]|uniref:flagellar protein FlaG n=1 Tax=Phenylobacterium sp. TaxID=1871053 RepID=UPI002FDA8639